MAPAGTPDLPQGDAKVRAVREMFDTIAPRYDLVNTIMTFGLDRRWRKAAVRRLALPSGARVLDVACGPGEMCRELRSAGYRPVGVDLSMGMLAHRRTTDPLLHADALELPLAAGSFDGAVSAFGLRNFMAVAPLFAELARIVRPGGRVSLLDVAVPPSPFLRAGHSVYFGHVVPRIGAVLSDRDAYRYLPRSVAYLPGPPEMLRSLHGAGFADERRELLTCGLTQLLTATRTDPPR